ncbi:MAG: GTPase HflX [Eubacteriales bacterium]|nr:GTPase HflX [Eubacteriales bacterium]
MNDSFEKVVLAGVYETAGNAETEEKYRHSMDELWKLAEACNMEPVCEVTQRLPHRNTAFYIGTGKLLDIKESLELYSASKVIFNDTLSPSQIKNLLGELGVEVMDRTALILEIFKSRARTREARLQVELARLKYVKPRLIGMWETQNRQGGASGSMSSKGEGETQLELDRRSIDHRLAELRRELTVVERERATQRKRRKASAFPLVSLVGYTNAGKSTIMNSFVKKYSTEDKKVFENDMLFATLDTTVRRIELPGNKDFLISDTVGFIQKLPTSLIEAFKSTLEEVTEADLLLQVVDFSDEHYAEHMEVTQAIINELGAGHIPMLLVFNKADLRAPGQDDITYPSRGMSRREVSGAPTDCIYISAKDEASLELLKNTIVEKIFNDRFDLELVIPYEEAAAASAIMKNAAILEQSYEDDGLHMRALCREEDARRYRRFSLTPLSFPEDEVY